MGSEMNLHENLAHLAHGFGLTTRLISIGGKEFLVLDRYTYSTSPTWLDGCTSPTVKHMDTVEKVMRAAYKRHLGSDLFCKIERK